MKAMLVEYNQDLLLLIKKSESEVIGYKPDENLLKYFLLTDSAAVISFTKDYSLVDIPNVVLEYIEKYPNDEYKNDYSFGIRIIGVIRNDDVHVLYDMYRFNFLLNDKTPAKLLSVDEYAKHVGKSIQSVRYMLANNRIEGIVKKGRTILIPENTEYPRDYVKKN